MNDELFHFRLRQKVIKRNGDYTFKGVVTSQFRKLSGKVRYVVEDDRGICHIFSNNNLESNELEPS